MTDSTEDSAGDTPLPPGDGITRRKFVEKTSLVTGGTLLAGAFAGCGESTPGLGAELAAGVPAAGVPAAGDGILKLALVGCGGRGSGAVFNAMKADKRIHLVAIADVFADRAESALSRLQRRFGKHRVRATPDTTFTGLEGFKQAIALADVVVLATPGGFRPEHFEYAVAQNKHVFMEKPVATDAPGIRRVLKAARVADERKLNVVVGLQRRYSPMYLELFQRYRDGVVGDIVAGQVYWNGNSHMDHRSFEREPGQSELDYQLRNWYFFNWLSGDHILEQNLHNIDVANWFIGEFPETAQGNGGRQVRTDKKYGQIFDNHFVEFVYPSGAVIHAQCRQIEGTLERVQEQFQTTGGEIETNVSMLVKGAIRKRGGGAIYEHRGLPGGNPYQIEHNRLFAAIRSGEHINNAEYAAKSTLAAIMGRMATYSGQEIKWEEAMSSDLRLVQDSEYLAQGGALPVMPDESGHYPIPMPGSTRVL